MESVTCFDCGNEWPKRATSAFNSHFCIGTQDITLDALLNYLEVEADVYGCLIPTQVRAFHRAGHRGNYLQLRPYVSRMIGEVYVHRAVFLLSSGKRGESGMHVSHECAPPHYENSHCANPSHLVVRTPEENHAYMSPTIRARISRAGAAASPTKLKPGHVPWNKGRTNK